MGRIIVTEPNFTRKYLPEQFAKLTDAGHVVVSAPFPVHEADLRRLASDAEAIVAGPAPISAAVIESAPRLRVIARFGVGVDNVDVDTATRRKVIVTNALGANSDAVADFVLCLMLSLSRDIRTVAEIVPSGHWRPFIGVELWEKTLGVIGTGDIGRKVIRRASGFDMKILAYDISPDEYLASSYGVRYVGLNELLADSDYVSVHLPACEGTHGLIGAAQFGLMKPGAFFINTARGSIVDDDAVLTAVRDGSIAGAALDVFSREPPENAAAFNVRNLIATPHIASSTNEAIVRVGDNCARNVLNVLADKEPVSPVNYPFTQQ